MPEAGVNELSWTLLIGVFVLAYLIGSIPFGLVLTRLAGLGDIRAVGSGNIGATNVLRTGRTSLAAATLLLDALKGTLAVWVGWRWGPGAALAAALGAYLGHCFPIWLKFKGGKGVATFLGVLLGLHWPTMVVAALVWLATAFATRYSSLSALMASIAAPTALLLFGEPLTAMMCVVLTILIWVRHADNLKRLKAGTESRIGEKS